MFMPRSFTGCGEEYHPSYSFHQCYYLSCLCFGNLKDGIWMQQDDVKLFDVCFCNSISSYPDLQFPLHVIFYFSCLEAFDVIHVSDSSYGVGIMGLKVSTQKSQSL